MNKQQAYNSFWSGFGVPAYEENTVPEGAAFPYITYQVLIDDIYGVLTATASIWDKTTSWKRVDLLSNLIAERIVSMNTLKLDEGRMFITKGSPFAQHMMEEGDSSIRRVVLNIGVQFFTEF